jgi:hypothetical protein
LLAAVLRLTRLFVLMAFALALFALLAGLTLLSGLVGILLWLRRRR